MVPVWNDGAPVSAEAGEVEPSASCGTPLLFGVPSMLTDAGGVVLVRNEAGTDGAQAQIRYWWLRNEPPKAPSKKLSASTYCWASA